MDTPVPFTCFPGVIVPAQHDIIVANGSDKSITIQQNTPLGTFEPLSSISSTIDSQISLPDSETQCPPDSQDITRELGTLIHSDIILTIREELSNYFASLRGEIDSLHAELKLLNSRLDLISETYLCTKDIDKDFKDDVIERINSLGSCFKSIISRLAVDHKNEFIKSDNTAQPLPNETSDYAISSAMSSLTPQKLAQSASDVSSDASDPSDSQTSQSDSESSTTPTSPLATTSHEFQPHPMSPGAPLPK